MNEIKKDREDQGLQELLKEQSKYTELQEKTGKKFGPVIEDLKKRVKDSLKGISSQEK